MPFKDKDFAKEYHKQKSRDWMKADRDNNLEKYKERERSFRENNPSKRLLYSTKQTAKKKNIEHSLVESDIICPVLCPYLGIQIDYRAGVGKHMFNPSVDRINPKLGYIKDNIEVISSLANTMKCNATVEQLLAFANEVNKRYATKTSTECSNM